MLILQSGCRDGSIRIKFSKDKSKKMFSEYAKKPGWIEVICGSMFSAEEVVSHDATAIMSTPVESSASILLLSGDVDVVGIDEAQFFDDGIVDVCRQLASSGIRVIAAGLDMDYLGKPFGPMPALMAVAEYVDKVHAICVRCGDPALHSHRLSASDRLVELGEKDIYEPLCRHCFNKCMENSD